MTRRHGRVDANHAEIVEALRRCGATVVSLADVGEGCPDLLVGVANATELVEVKGLRGKLTEDQITWHVQWRGRPVRVIRSVEEVLALLDEMRGVIDRNTILEYDKLRS